ncbi:MAG TPA: hypothetical protein VGN22_07700 [Pseudonocardia sp.]
MEAGWRWSAIRPSVVAGFALGNPMNLAVVLAVYASISKELGIPLRFPGRPGAYDALLELTDAGLSPRRRCGRPPHPRCANEAFNIVNGDLFRWNRMWPVIADAFGLQVAAPLPMSLTDVTADKQPVWDAMVARRPCCCSCSRTCAGAASSRAEGHGKAWTTP